MNTRAVSQPVQAIAISAIVLATLLGGFILAVNDRNLNPIGLPNPIGPLVAVVPRTPVGTQALPPGSGTPIALTETPTLTPTPTPTLTPTPVCAPPPIDWVLVEYNQSQTTLFMLAQRYGTTLERLIEVNCLDKTPLLAIQLLYVPATAPATAPTLAPTAYPANCFPPPGWTIYIVQWGDTLSRLSVRYNVSIEVLMRYNCLTSTLLYQGRRLYVPYSIPVATFTPSPFPTLTWTPAPTRTPTPVTVTPSDTPTPPPTPTWTPTPISVTPSDTPTPPPTPTWTPTPTDTPEPPITPTWTPLPTDTPTTVPPPTVAPSLTPTSPPPLPPTETSVPPTQSA